MFNPSTFEAQVSLPQHLSLAFGYDDCLNAYPASHARYRRRINIDGVLHGTMGWLGTLGS